MELRVGAGGGGFCAAAGRISTAARFHRSLVGAVSFSVAWTPLSAFVEVCRWTQKVSPTGARYSSTLVWFEPTVRAAAASQSSPTPHTWEPARVLVSDTDGAPVAALAPAVAPSTT